MRSHKSQLITSDEVQSCVSSWLSEAVGLPDHVWKCTSAVVWMLLIRAAARQQSICAACRDLKDAPSDQAMLNALHDGLPKYIRVLERWLVVALQTKLLRHSREVAIDWHLIPYHGEPQKSASELSHSVPKSGTTKFHAYATACVVENGWRDTIALTWIKKGEKPVVVLQRLWEQIAQIGLNIKVLLLDRQFFSVPVMTWLISQRQPFLMPVVLRGRKSQKRRKATGLRATHLADPDGELRLERLRFRRLLEWLAKYAYSQLHDHSPPYVVIDN